jgi:hypothetical protein
MASVTAGRNSPVADLFRCHKIARYCVEARETNHRVDKVRVGAITVDDVLINIRVYPLTFLS